MGAAQWAARSCICICTPSSRCSTARPVSVTSWPPPRPTGSPRSASPITATCTAFSISTAPARKAGLTPVIGTEAYFVTTSRFDRPRRADHEIFHLTLLAETNEGYRNLIKVSSHAYLDGFFSKPRVDFELLERHHAGLIATTGCLGGAVCQALLKGDYTGARDYTAQFQDILGRDSFFIELQDHGLPEQREVNPMLVKLAQELHAPLLATNDSHYTHKEDAAAHDALLCVQTGATNDDPKRFKFDAEEFYLKSAAEMRHLFADYPEACDSTLLIAERANVEIEFGKPKLPSFPVPDGHDEDTYLAELALQGAKERYGDSPPLHVLERIEFELDVIRDMGFSAYFLVVWDLVRYAKSNGIRVGPGRGARRGRASRTACASSTSTRSSTTCCSSGSSTAVASRCPTSTWTSTSGTAAT